MLTALAGFPGLATTGDATTRRLEVAALFSNVAHETDSLAIIEEKIFHMAGATTPQEQSAATLQRVIREAGREPVQRDSHYCHITSPRKRSTSTVAPAETELACA